MDRLTSMAVFVKAAETGSFASAGEALSMSSQLVGKHVRFLEERFGMRLISRTTRRQSLTEAGRAFYERSKAVLAEVEAAEALADSLQAVPRGKLRVNAPVSWGAYSLTPMLARYVRKYPEVSVDLTLTDRVVDLIDEGYEAVIRVAPIADSGLIARPLAPFRLVVCASPAYLAEYGTPERPEDLAEHECVGFAYWARPPAVDWEFKSAQGTHRVRLKSRFSINNGQALRAAAVEGAGIVLQPRDMLQEDLAAGRLVELLPGFEAPSLPMHLLYAPDRRPTPKLRSFIDFVVETFGE
ncbi:LysR family transcriptional regulator [Trinickia sp. YCB016]